MPILRPENVWLSIQSVGDEFLSYGPIAYVTHFFELSVIFKWTLVEYVRSLLKTSLWKIIDKK